MKKIVTTLLVMALAATAASAVAGDDVHWSYSGSTGPANWATLCDEFSECSGHNQSPINLTGFLEVDLPPLGFTYAAGGYEILNNGHTVGVHYDAGSHVTADGIDFELKQFHFHSPSENQIDGENFDMEIHLVHVDADGNVAVVAAMVGEGAANPALATLWAKMPQAADDTNPLPAKFDIDDLLPPARDYYRFNGSFTTPPCTEGVRWFVLKAPITASKDQIKAFTGVMKHPNNRPIQPTNARLILK